jgi:CheY-like chemotaxis protein
MSHSVLIVDDDPTTRYVLSSFLRLEGYATATAENGAVGVRRLVEAKPCVILLDIEMPIMDGYDFRDVQKRIAPDAFIVCISGTADPEQAARAVGASRLHAKPLDVAALCRSIADLCELPHSHPGADQMNVPAGVERRARPRAAGARWTP